MKRREFLNKTAIVSAGSLAGLTIYSCNPGDRTGKTMKFPGPNDTINLGIIGLGMRARQLIQEFHRIPKVKFLAISDIDDQRIERAAGMINTHNGSGEKPCATYKDFRELIDREDIDGVIVATPDHWHAIISVMAIKAGKDVYCEKPFTHTISEGRAVIDAANKYERIVQVGSQQRSHQAFRDAVNYVRSGYIGEVKAIKEQSSARFPVPFDLETVKAPDYMDWDMWMGPAPYFDYNAELCPDVSVHKFPAWRAYREWGGGGIADLGAHMYDIAQWGMDMDGSGPVEVLLPTDSDVESLTYKYSNGVLMNKEDFGMGPMSIMFEGTEGWAAAGRWWMKTSDNLANIKLDPENSPIYQSTNHYYDWIQSMRSRKQPICNPEVGHRSATVCNIGIIAEQVGESLKWDPKREKFNLKEANKLKSYRYRGDWKL